MFNLVECEHDPALMPGWGGWMKCSCTVWRSTVWWVGCSLSFFIWMPGAFRDAPRASLITYRLIGTSIQPPLQKDPDYPFKKAVSSQLYIEIRKCNHENTKERECNWLYSVIPPMERGGGYRNGIGAFLLLFDCLPPICRCCFSMLMWFILGAIQTRRRDLQCNTYSKTIQRTSHFLTMCWFSSLHIQILCSCSFWSLLHVNTDMSHFDYNDRSQRNGTWMNPLKAFLNVEPHKHVCS